MYSTPLIEAVSLCRRDFKISWGWRRVRERGKKIKSCLPRTFSMVQRILGYHYEFYSGDLILFTGQNEIGNISF